MPIHRRKQVLVNVVDGLAKVKPHATYAYLPISPTGYEKGFRKLTYQKFANAVNGLAWWLTTQFGKSTSFETLTYVGPNDFLHNALILACAKTGYKLFLASFRNQRDALTALFRQIDVKAVLTADPKSELTARYQEASPMPAFQVPTVEVLLKESFPHYPYHKTFEEAKNDPLVIFHTSGTTGSPKPITYTNGWVAAYMQAMQTLPPEGMEMKDKFMCGTRFFVMMPPFHAANIFTVFWIPFANETTIIYPPKALPPTMEAFIEGIKSIQVDTAFIPPHFVSQLAANEDLLKIVSDNVETLFTAGGKAVDAHGDIVAAKMAGQYLTTYGATETGNIPDMLPKGVPPSTNWSYISPHPAAGWDFRLHKRTDAHTVYEAIIVRNKDQDMEQPVFKMFPELEEYSTRDLYLRHPTQPDLWKWAGRTDDTIVLASGANVSPMVMESGVSEHPAVQGVVMVGSGHLRPALILEPRNADMDGEELVGSVWPTVEKLNSTYFEDHQILRSHILVTAGNRPMARSMKGSIQRSVTVDLYEADMEDLCMRSG
ncbi:acetyl-CoA synthetase-like protein [Mytilinidion resinicola]|uniref:Acetyl-CoA synthetase-like protein n=1 Tax=Mytilinidion resinicola TaxID=574789 RepID=A0A6A6YEV2_9PEZI|nr:acetyl-CoA synthetase-like protein [Mytilinidion resinicola]KAF2807321.1 acetyl-CoA synthetase-like protein [Mytilinidion resinicola]